MPQLKLLGGAFVEDDACRPSESVSRRHPLALLAILARAPNATSSRSKIVGLLWPDSSERVARNRLGTCIHRVRKQLGDPVLVSVGDDLRLDRGILDCDACLFEDALTAKDFARAVALYGGPFLDGFYLRGSVDFEQWVDGERDRLQRDYWAALEALAEAEESRGEPATAAKWWRARLVADPLDTRVANRLVTALREAGNPGEAQRVAHRHREALLDELGTEPGDQFRGLLAELEGPTGVAARPTPPDPAETSAQDLVEWQGPPNGVGPVVGGGVARRTRRTASVLMLVGVLSGAGAGVWYLAAAGAAKRPDSQAGAREAARELYLQGERLDHTRPKTGQIALRRAELYGRAVQIDPDFAAAWAGLADAQVGVAWFSTSKASTRAWADSARASARTALALDPRLAAAYAEIGDSYWVLGGHTDEQIAAYEQAIALDPANREAINNLVVLLERSGRLAEAMRILDRVNRASGTDAYAPMLVMENAMLGRDSVAEAWIARSRRIGHSSPTTEFVYALLYRRDTARARQVLDAEETEMADLALRRARAALALSVDDWATARRICRGLYPTNAGSSVPAYQGLLSAGVCLALALHHLGEQEEASEIAAEVLARARQAIVPGADSYLPRHRAAAASLILGDTAAALRYLEQSVDGGYRNVRFFQTVPTLDPLRRHPRFVGLLDRMDAMLVEQRRVVDDQGWGRP